MAYKTIINKQFSGKGFVDVDNLVFISSDKKTAGETYDLQEIFSKIGGSGEEITITVKVTDSFDHVESDEE